MRYADGGGLTSEGRSRRKLVRLQAAEMFARDADARQIAESLRVSTKSVYQWRRAWRSGKVAALASKGAGGNPCKLDEPQLAQLRAALVDARAVTAQRLKEEAESSAALAALHQEETEAVRRLLRSEITTELTATSRQIFREV